MLLALIAAASAQTTTIDPGMVRSPPEPGRCDPELARTATISPAEARRLGDLPPGVIQFAVNKRVARCSVTVLPQRDQNGQHLMMRGVASRLSPAHEGRSRRDAGSQRQR